MSRFTVAAALLFVCACATSEGEAPRQLEPAELPRVVAPEQVHGAPSPAAEYVEATETYRVFGTEHAGTDRARAVVANVRTWETRTLRTGDLLGRSWRIGRIEADRVELAGADGAGPVLRTGVDAPVHEITHRYDRAVRYEGGHKVSFDRRALADVARDKPAGLAVEERAVFGERGLALTQVDEGGLADRLGLRPGDVVFSIDGAPATPETLAGLGTYLVDHAQARVRFFRSTSLQERVFVAR